MKKLYVLVLIGLLILTGCDSGSKKPVEPPPPIVMCEWDATIPASSPVCVEPPPPEMCEWDETIPADDPACVEPPPCEWDETIPADDPACVEPPPPPPPCEWDETIPADDPACVQPACEIMLAWVNPTEDISDNTLEPDELVAATLYQFRIPEEPREIDMVFGEISPYLLMHTLLSDEHGITFYFQLTVSNLDNDGNPQESDVSNQVTRLCT